MKMTYKGGQQTIPLARVSPGETVLLPDSEYLYLVSDRYAPPMSAADVHVHVDGRVEEGCRILVGVDDGDYRSDVSLNTPVIIVPSECRVLMPKAEFEKQLEDRPVPK